jgi:hypothetical protein
MGVVGTPHKDVAITYIMSASLGKVWRITYNVLWMKCSLLFPTFGDFDSPSTFVVLLGFGHGRLGPDGKFHGGSVPFHEQTKLLCWRIGGPVFGKGKVWKVIGPVGKVQG